MGSQPIQNKSKAQPLARSGSKSMTEAPALQLSAKAVEKIKAFARENASLADRAFRVAIDGGGCAGFRYTFAFDEVNEDEATASKAIIKRLPNFFLSRKTG